MKTLHILFILLFAGVGWASEGSWPSESYLSPSGGGGITSITDDFSGNTVANYTAITGSGFAISGGYATAGAGVWDYAGYVHNSTLNSNNHYLDATVEIASSSTGVADLVVRSNGTTGYVTQIYWDGSQVNLEKFSGGTTTYVGTFVSPTYASGFHRFRLEVVGSVFTLKHWNGTAWDQVGDSITDTSYTSGGKIGFWFRNNGSNARVDTFSAATL